MSQSNIRVTLVQHSRVHDCMDGVGAFRISVFRMAMPSVYSLLNLNVNFYYLRSGVEEKVRKSAPLKTQLTYSWPCPKGLDSVVANEPECRKEIKVSKGLSLLLHHLCNILHGLRATNYPETS